MDGALADFLRLVFALLNTSRPMHLKSVLDMDRTLANLSMQDYGPLCTVRPLASGKTVICMDGALAKLSLT